MTVNQFLKKHSINGTEPWRNYCEAIITPDGRIHEAKPSHVEWCIRYACKQTHLTRDELDAIMPIACSPIHWLTKVFQLTCIWYETILAPTSCYQNKKVMATLQTLKDAKMLYADITDMASDWPGYRTLKDDYIVFLDIDGVLNHAGCKSETDFLPNAVAVLNLLHYKYQAKIVISSSWRTCYTLKQLQDLFTNKGILCDVIDKTPVYTGKFDQIGNNVTLSEEEFNKRIGENEGRNAEVLSYIRTHDICHYVILDDWQFSNPELYTHQIETCWFDEKNGGLNLNDLPAIYHIFDDL